jgi:hypothetical protein
MNAGDDSRCENCGCLLRSSFAGYLRVRHPADPFRDLCTLCLAALNPRIGVLSGGRWRGTLGAIAAPIGSSAVEVSPRGDV